MMSSAILLIAHGSRRAAANADLVKLAEIVRTRCPQDIVEIAYLELAEPTIPQGAARCVERGATHVRMSPFFLSAGTHIAEDLTSFQTEFSAQFPNVQFQLCPPLGLHSLLVEALLERMNEVWVKDA
jgi:sirohydrochlorin ferrochelatase